MSKRIVIGISGASGVIYGVRMLSLLKEKDFETHLILSEAGKKNIEIETSLKSSDVAAMATHVYDNKDVGAALASGSFLTEGMVVVPCTIKTLSGIANSYTDNLLVRAADMGAHILPPVPSFYHQPKTIDDIIDQTIGKIFDYLGIKHDLFRRWGEG